MLSTGSTMEDPSLFNWKLYDSRLAATNGKVMNDRDDFEMIFLFGPSQQFSALPGLNQY